MFCFKCGANMPEDATVCPQCATPVEGAPVPPTPPAPPAGGPAPSATSAFLNPPSAQPQYPPQAQYPPQGQPQYYGGGQVKTDGGAIVSLVLGIASFALCLSFLTGIPAIILGHISWSKIRRSAGRLKGEGMALTGLILGYLSLPFLLIVAAIAIPNLLRARITANEAEARSTIRTISTLQVTYETTYPNQGYAPDLAALGNGPGGECSGGGTAAHACLLEGTLGSARCTSGVWCPKNVYRYTISSDCTAPSPAENGQPGSEAACKEFVVTASPLISSTGSHNYCATSDGVIRSHLGGPLTKAPTAEECGGWTPF
ncbi:MAG TPA: DUF4190 domain-containing protein [Candidatus Angelobacter sp.]|nr:DUF4190 domain-containing protein [Candidatus Angelobacter sp.]